ncbi:hypothetical protein J2Y45_000192 [Dyadobacter sp. BE34]|uniref:Uncharacterized protein n=1 Tax=Dyadobacter fermentans TaxID=94254 RepID=A0ABU1R963_9BACT|nr:MULTISPECIES: DUF2281 domain-containing protein [Dyadobacter]MDR6809439.1 hypothetical protein [Dyadobacter fermentans]MDR7047389.1 hypothetical protein [Dyadobacter sp. BE242]MDR7195066.1 hypothetical protein [Dyadobacter sp. BE34]MDR7214389.1 hypothetical protein [Dyadobacter sp. BE31]MDR7266988.1 hypothetical protein [Dyadobacter sp. BE32]
MNGIRYIIDSEGNKTDVVIDLKEHGQIVEDLLDSLLVKERKNEESMLFEDFIKQLVAGGKVIESSTKKPLRFGMMKGTIIMSEDFDDPLDFS